MSDLPANDDLSSASETAGSRLCAACGMCCNGSLFHMVYLQPGDSPKAIAALGLKLKFKKQKYFFYQPCAAFKNSCCSIYAERPTRCRAFECRQLKRVESGVSNEAEALEKIREAQAQIALVEQLLTRAGERKRDRPLGKRYEKIMEQPLDAESSPEQVAAREALSEAMHVLEEFLETHFRV